MRMSLYMILRGFLMKFHMQNKNWNYISNSNWYSNRLEPLTQVPRKDVLMKITKGQ
jgi:hypothetical protein